MDKGNLLACPRAIKSLSDVDFLTFIFNDHVYGSNNFHHRQRTFYSRPYSNIARMPLVARE